jgi:hypothetical protein
MDFPSASHVHFLCNPSSSFALINRIFLPRPTSPRAHGPLTLSGRFVLFGRVYSLVSFAHPWLSSIFCSVLVSCSPCLRHAYTVSRFAIHIAHGTKTCAFSAGPRGHLKRHHYRRSCTLRAVLLTSWDNIRECVPSFCSITRV